MREVTTLLYGPKLESSDRSILKPAMLLSTLITRLRLLRSRRLQELPLVPSMTRTPRRMTLRRYSPGRRIRVVLITISIRLRLVSRLIRKLMIPRHTSLTAQRQSLLQRLPSSSLPALTLPQVPSRSVAIRWPMIRPLTVTVMLMFVARLRLTVLIMKPPTIASTTSSRHSSFRLLL